MNISKKQRKMSEYSIQSDSIGFSGRKKCLRMVYNILETINLTKSEKSSIFHRF